MKTKLIIGLFICVAIAQIVAPLSMIAKRECVFKNGAQFKFKTIPIDPYDVFRGRYVALRLENDYIPKTKETKLRPGEDVYALIETDNDGFSRVISATTVKPSGEAYIRAKIRYSYDDKTYLDLPIDRYYMEEKAAPIAEKIYRQHTQRNKQDAYVVVRIKDGFVVIENLFVGGQKIEDAVRQDTKRQSIWQ